MVINKSGRNRLLKLLAVIVSILMIINVETPTKYGATTSENELVVHLISCGQAESILLVQGDYTMLIDCGKVSTGRLVVKYLKSLGITQIDTIMGTHFHEDHVGGMYNILVNFEVDTVIFPKTKEKRDFFWYSNLMNKIQSGEYQIKYAEPGDIYSIGEARMEVLEAETNYGENLNNSSIVSKVTFGEMDMLLTSDAEKEIEEKLIKSGKDIDVEILKIGHHGSNTSSMPEFIDKVNPEYALISCKLGNDYGHPVKDTMSRLEDRNIEIHRTDECGTVVMTITHDDVSFDCKPGDYLSGEELKEKSSIIYIIKNKIMELLKIADD